MVQPAFDFCDGLIYFSNSHDSDIPTVANAAGLSTFNKSAGQTNIMPAWPAAPEVGESAFNPNATGYVCV